VILISLIVIPLIFAGIVAAAPAKQARIIALIGNLAAALLTFFAFVLFPWDLKDAGMQFLAEVTWLPALGLNLSVGADSLSMMLIGLTALLGPICVVASTTAITERVKTYFVWLLVLQAAMFGVFAARDLILFYICFEFTLVPMFILISLYGSTNRRAAAIKFFLYTFTGSMLALAGLVYVAWVHASQSGEWTFSLDALQASASTMSAREQALVLLALLLGFAVKVPVFPFHTWLPLAHTEAPTAGSVLLAGVLLKLGTYGIVRFAVPYCPLAFIEYAPLIGALAVVGILYGGLICWVQTDVKKLVAYSSVAHLGFCVLGIASLNHAGLLGSILYMINHGLSTGALFLCIGMIYERYHTRSMKELGGLAARMPIWSTFMVFFVMASVGLPGLNGFVSEFLCLLGTFQSSSAWGSSLWGSRGGLSGGEVAGATRGELGPWFAAIAGIGMVIAAMYLLYMTGKVVWGPLVEPHAHGHSKGAGHASGADSHGAQAHDSAAAAGHGKHDHHEGLPTDLNLREILTLVPLAALCLILGVYPKPMIDALEAPVHELTQRVEAARDVLASGSNESAAKASTAVASEAQK